MTLNESLEDKVREVLLPMIERGDTSIDPITIADAVDHLIDPDTVAPPLKTFASTMHIRNAARRFLRKHYDPVEKAKNCVEGQTQDMFGNVLQDYYPAKRAIGDETEISYIRREAMTQIDIERVCSRMEKSGQSLIKHARLLRAYGKTVPRAA